MAAGKSPGVIFSMEFFQSDKYMVGNHDFLDYMQRPQAFDPAKHVDDEFKDFYDYMKNEEKSDGIFDLKNNLLSQEQISEYRQLEMSSKAQGCPKYVGVISFTNEFLEESGVISPRGIDTNRLKAVARSGMSEMVHTSNKLDDDNVYWTAAIHTNTDNVHIHFAILEKEKRHREKDMLEVKAFDKLKSKVANKLIGDERTIKITEIARQSLLPDMKREFYNGHTAIVQLARVLPPDQTWQYGRKSFEPYREIVNYCVRSIINSSPSLRKSFNSYIDELDNHEKKLAEVYGIGERHLYKDFKQNKLEDFYNRAGNSLLEYIKTNGLYDAPGFEKLRRPAEEKNRDKLSQTDYFDKGDFSKRKEASIFVSADEISESSETLKKLRPPTEEKNRDNLSQSQDGSKDLFADMVSSSESEKSGCFDEPKKLCRPAEEKNRDKLSRSQENPQLNFKANDRINDVRSQSGSQKIRKAQQPYRNHQSFGHYLSYKRDVAKTIAYHTGRLANEQEHHVHQLMREFEYEQSIHLNR